MKKSMICLELNNINETIDPSSEVYTQFLDAMRNDLNTPNAFAAIFEACKQLNNALRKREADFEEIATLTTALKRMLHVLGIAFEEIKLSEEDHRLFAEWETAKAQRDFTKADEYRNRLTQRGLL